MTFRDLASFLSSGSAATEQPVAETVIQRPAETPVSVRQKDTATLGHMSDLLASEQNAEMQIETMDAAARLHGCVDAANFVKNLRVRNNVTQQQLSDMSGIRQATISDIERLRLENGPNVGTLAVLARACGTDIKFE